MAGAVERLLSAQTALLDAVSGALASRGTGTAQKPLDLPYKTKLIKDLPGISPVVQRQTGTKQSGPVYVENK